MDDLSRAFAALADPTRRAIIAQIASGPVTVGDIVARHSLSQPAISKHLKVLEEARLVRRDRVARTRPCSLDPKGLAVAARWIDVYRSYWEDAFKRIDELLLELGSGRGEWDDESGSS